MASATPIENQPAGDRFGNYIIGFNTGISVTNSTGIDARTVARSAIDDLKSLVREFPGDYPVIVELLTSRGPKRLRLGASFRVRPESAFFAEVRARLGDATLA